MKKLLLLLCVGMLSMQAAHARLRLINNTSCDIYVTVFVHGVASDVCDYYESTLITVAGGSSVTFNSASDLGPCFAGGSGTATTIPPSTQGWDDVKFFTGSAMSPDNLGSAGICTASGTFWQGSGNFCGGSVLSAAWTNPFGTPSTVTVTFSN